jgi:hypothetical protein
LTVLASLTSRQFLPQTRDIPFTVGANLTRFVVTLTHPDWPEGECVRISVDFGNGFGGEWRLGGGVIRDKQGNPTGGTRDLVFTCNKPPDVTGGTVRVQVMQTLTSAVVVEGL